MSDKSFGYSDLPGMVSVLDLARSKDCRISFRASTLLNNHLDKLSDETGMSLSKLIESVVRVGLESLEHEYKLLKQFANSPTEVRRGLLEFENQLSEEGRQFGRVLMTQYRTEQNADADTKTKITIFNERFANANIDVIPFPEFVKGKISSWELSLFDSLLITNEIDRRKAEQEAREADANDRA